MLFGKEEYREINANLNAKLGEKKFLIAQHRGGHNGNVPQNTNLAFKASLLLGADMFELDVSKSTDGELYCFHDNTEDANLRVFANLETFSSAAISEFQFYNSIRLPSGYPLQKLEETLQEFCHGELFNVDRCWLKLQDTFALLKKYPHALNQALMKAPAKAEFLDQYEAEPTKFMFMPIVKTLEDIELVLSYKNINLVGFELIANGEDSPLWDDALIEKLHNMGCFVWYNAITLSCQEKHILCAGCDDDRSIKEGYEKGWGELVRKGADIIQTDWPALLRDYRDSLSL